MEKTITVGEASKLLEVSEDTIRRWERKGLIKSKRDKNNYRVFDTETLTRLHKKLSGSSSESKFQVHKSENKSKYTSIDLFAGAGGTALGLENAGLSHKLLVEIDKNAVNTLKTNRPDWNVHFGDVKDCKYSGIDVDVVEGGFPCQSFSYAGKGLGFGDTRGTLFFEFVRCVKEVRPKIAIGENVKGLLKHDNGKTLATMLNELSKVGYKIAYRVLKAQYLDVPQKRERLVILAVRNDLDLPILFPKEKEYTVSIKEAFKDCPESEGQKYPKRKAEILAMVPPGGYWKDLPTEIQKEFMGGSYYLGGGKTGMARRLSWDEPSLTLTCSPAQKQTERCHPGETRPLNVREYARIQTFPDYWKFSGSTASQYKQIGNAVPVNLGYYIGKCAIAMLDKNPDFETMEEPLPSEYYQPSEVDS